MIKLIKLYFHGVLCLCIGSGLLAQTDSTQHGEIVTDQIIIEKEKEIKLSTRQKPFIELDFKKFQNQPLDIRQEDFVPQFSWPDYTVSTPYTVTKREPIQPAYQNYVLAGYGNFGSPLLKAFIYQETPFSDLSLRLFHESFNAGPINGNNSANSNTSIELQGSTTTSAIDLIPFISYSNHTYRFYGSTVQSLDFPNRVLPKASLSNFSIGTKLTLKDKDYLLELSPRLQLMNQGFANGITINNDTEFKLDGSLSYPLKESIDGGIRLSVATSQYDGGLAYGRNFFGITPWFSKRMNQVAIEGGFQVASSRTNDLNQSGFFPNLSVTYSANEIWSIKGFLNSGIEWNSFNEVSSLNNFLADSLELRNENTRYKVGLHINGKINQLIISSSISYRDVSSMPIFIPSLSDSSSFQLVYDDSIEIFTFETNFSYIVRPGYSYFGNITLNNYATSQLQNAWHLPTIDATIGTSFSFGDKITTKIYGIFLGGIKGALNTPFSHTDQLIINKELPVIVDMNIDVSYQLNKRSSAFVMVNNITGNEYQRFAGFPVRGLSFKLGGKYRF